MILICILVVQIYSFLIFWYKHSNRIPKHISVHLCVMLAFVKRVFVGEGRAVLTIDEAEGVDPVKLWCLFACASEVTNFLPPCWYLLKFQQLFLENSSFKIHYISGHFLLPEKKPS